MYTRNFGKQKYTPPPGYDGTAFGGNVTTKHHEPTKMIRAEDGPDISVEPVELSPEEVTAVAEILPENGERTETEHPMRQLLASLRGKFGSEELIILLVMMLIAADGFGAEMLILGILLAAGN